MPYIWTSVDTRNALISSALPAGIAAAGCCCLSKDDNVAAFVRNFRLPRCTFSNPLVHASIDLAVLSPLGYASYLVYKDGGGFDYTDTTVALSLYGLNLAGLTAFIPAFKSRNLIAIATVSILNTVTAAATALTFAGISKKAGWLLVPYVLWSSYYAALTVNIYQNGQNGNN